jgi:hypothetical protein
MGLSAKRYNGDGKDDGISCGINERSFGFAFRQAPRI